MAIKGNHEIEEQVESTTFAAYSARFAFPSEESGSNSAMYYSFNARGIQVLMLDGYTAYDKSYQYKWLQRDLEKVDRGVTLWLVGVWHPPWYNTYVSHYKEVECMRVAMEEVLYNAGVDIKFNGHVYANYDEPLRIELLQLATLLLKYLQTNLVHHRKELIKFGWNHLKGEDSANVAPFYTMFVGFSVLSQLSLHPEYFTSRVALVYLIISLGLPYNTTLDNRHLAIELAGLVVNWERQRENEMKIVDDGDGSSQNNDVSSITSNDVDPKRSVDGPTLKTELDPLLTILFLSHFLILPFLYISKSKVGEGRRLFRLEKNQNCLVRDRIINGLWARDWRRPVNGGRALVDLNNLLMDIGSLNVEVDRDCVVSSLSTDASYSVRFIRKHIDNCMIANSLLSTRWCKIIPRKVNIFMWRLLLDRLPRRLNLSSRGLDIDSILCPVCSEHVESNSHAFFSCSAASNIWRLVRGWRELKIPKLSSCDEWDIWYTSWKASKVEKDRAYVIFAATCWMLWCFRNNHIFNSQDMRKCEVFDNIQCFFFLVKTRGKKCISWSDWLKSPL
ncbi:RNA-directed DNA polymerase, eukaryota [Tanacetum coccineum]